MCLPRFWNEELWSGRTQGHQVNKSTMAARLSWRSLTFLTVALGSEILALRGTLHNVPMQSPDPFQKSLKTFLVSHQATCPSVVCPMDPVDLATLSGFFCWATWSVHVAHQPLITSTCKFHAQWRFAPYHQRTAMLFLLGTSLDTNLISLHCKLRARHKLHWVIVSGGW